MSNAISHPIHSLFTLFLFVFAFSTHRVQGQDGQDGFRATAVRTSIWPGNVINVCWEPSTAGQYDTEKEWVRNAIETTWGAHGLVHLVNWAVCNPGDGGIHIEVSDGDLAPHTMGVGSQLDGVAGGMVLNFAFVFWSTSCQGQREFCIRAIAVHEFGHALGFSHEQNRPDSPEECKDETQGPDGDWLVTRFDMASVMNYCNPNWNGNGVLSELDIEGLTTMYKRDLPLRQYHEGCTSVFNSRSPACMAAMHRYCFYNARRSVGYPQEVGRDEFGVLCADASWYGDVPWAEIPGCLENSQSASCYSSVHRYCDRIGKGGVGMIQELGNGVTGVGCVPTSSYQIVKTATLQALHPDCVSSAMAQDPPCIAAVHRYCSSNELGAGGAITELGSDEVAVGCISAATYIIAKV